MEILKSIRTWKPGNIRKSKSLQPNQQHKLNNYGGDGVGDHPEAVVDVMGNHPEHQNGSPALGAAGGGTINTNFTFINQSFCNEKKV